MTETWDLFQFGSVVQDYCDAADDDPWEETERRMSILQDYGNETREPVSEAIGNATGLFVLRANVDNRHGRLFYFFGPHRKQVIFVHALLMKKTRKIPKSDIDTAIMNKAIAEAQLKTIHAFKLTH